MYRHLQIGRSNYKRAKKITSEENPSIEINKIKKFITREGINRKERRQSKNYTKLQQWHEEL